MVRYWVLAVAACGGGTSPAKRDGGLGGESVPIIDAAPPAAGVQRAALADVSTPSATVGDGTAAAARTRRCRPRPMRAA